MICWTTEGFTDGVGVIDGVGVMLAVDEQDAVKLELGDIVPDWLAVLVTVLLFVTVAVTLDDCVTDVLVVTEVDGVTVDDILTVAETDCVTDWLAEFVAVREPDAVTDPEIDIVAEVETVPVQLALTVGVGDGDSSTTTVNPAQPTSTEPDEVIARARTNAIVVVNGATLIVCFSHKSVSLKGSVPEKEDQSVVFSCRKGVDTPLQSRYSHRD